MDRFVSHYMLRLDAKGRVSVPASFRAALARDGFDGLYCYPALDRPAIDAGTIAAILGVALLLGAISVWHALRARHPLIDLSLLRVPTFAVSTRILSFGSFIFLARLTRLPETPWVGTWMV